MERKCHHPNKRMTKKAVAVLTFCWNCYEVTTDHLNWFVNKKIERKFLHLLCHIVSTRSILNPKFQSLIDFLNCFSNFFSGPVVPFLETQLASKYHTERISKSEKKNFISTKNTKHSLTPKSPAECSQRNEKKKKTVGDCLLFYRAKNFPVKTFLKINLMTARN